MKTYIIIVAFLSFFKLFSQQNKEKVVIIFDNKNPKTEFRKNYFYIENQYFKYISEKRKKEYIRYADIKNDICTVADLNNRIKHKLEHNLKKNIEFYYSEFYNIYVYVEEKSGIGYLYPVERIWMVEDSIKD